MVKFLHTADWQLGFQRSFFSEDAQAQHNRARLEAVEEIGKVAQAEDAAFVVVAGDVFESNLVERQIVIQALDALRRVSVPVYLLPGNHDPLDPSSIYRSQTFLKRKPENVHVIETEEAIQAARGVQLVGAPWHSKRPGGDPAGGVFERLEPPPDGTLRIGVAHGTNDLMSPDPEHPETIRSENLFACIENGRLHYVALGDHHSTHELAPRVWYAGTPEPTRFKEKDPGNVLVVDLTDSTCTVQRRRIGKWRFIEKTWELHGRDELDGLAAWLDTIDDPPRTVVRLHLEGSASISMKSRIKHLLDDERARFALLDWEDDPLKLLVLPDEKDLDSLELAGFARKAFDELQDAVKRDQDQTDQDALVLLYRLARKVDA